MKNINLFAGPGAGKSTIASELFTEMKKRNDKVEYIQEYAKELTFGKDFTRLSDQLHILGEQHHRMYRLRDQVDFLIHDSPFVMGIVYLQKDIHLPKKLYKKLVTEMFKSYNNINIFLERDVDKFGYETYGRNQDLDEAIQKDKEIKDMLKKFDIPFITIKVGKKTTKKILNLLV